MTGEVNLRIAAQGSRLTKYPQLFACTEQYFYSVMANRTGTQATVATTTVR